ncbi:GAF and ANTAR domain-containing protein [Amycolatopsis sp. lyj-84]|uniref:GAF and ANTAR domain-containing protein n=1 Tax=Amycolatopsis sp. lyj-84 TaxID=2789284 RepID=UPI00397D6CE3
MKAALDPVAGAEYAGIFLVERGRKIRTGEPILVDDLATARRRWPSFAPQALGQGFASVHAMPLRLRSEVIGALNLFGRTVTPLSPSDIRVAQALADTIGILQERAIRRGEVLTEQLQTALNSRVIIEQAKGVLFHAGDLAMDQTFDVLRTYCRHHSVRLSGCPTPPRNSPTRTSIPTKKGRHHNHGNERHARA